MFSNKELLSSIAIKLEEIVDGLGYDDDEVLKVFELMQDRWEYMNTMAVEGGDRELAKKSRQLALLMAEAKKIVRS